MKLFVTVVLIIFLLHVVVYVESARKKQAKAVVDDDSVEKVNVKDVQEKLNKLKFSDHELSAAELFELEKEETNLKKNVYRAVLDHGENSAQKAKALHLLGKNLYQQEKFDQVVGIAKDIVQIHEFKDGVEHENTGDIL